MIKFNESKRNFLRTAAKSAGVLTVAAVAPLALIPLLKPEPKFHDDYDINSMYPWPAPDIGSLYLDTDADNIYEKITINEQYGKFGYKGQSDDMLDCGYFYAPYIPRLKITITG